jgi:hypothetical protein
MTEGGGDMRNFCKATLVVAAGLFWASGAAARSPYPIVFDSVQQLKRYGLALIGIGTSNHSLHFHNRCYYYGDGGWDLSISDELLSFFKSQGFSRRTACLALVSGIRFDPETGKRLATYILVDRKLLKRKGNEPSALSDELPLSLPKCFAGGTPYSDCAWNYDPLTGKKLAPNATVAQPLMWKNCRSDARTRKFCDHPWTAQEAGQRIEAFLSKPDAKCASPEVDSKDPDNRLIVGTIAIRCKFVALVDIEPASESTLIAWNTGATLYDQSAEFPKGHAYALFASGEAGPEVSPDVVKAAFNGEKPQSQLDPKRLREIWGAGTK